MTDIHLVHALSKTIKLAQTTIPADVTGLTVGAVAGNQVQLTTNPGGAAGAWSYGIFEVTTGVAKGLKSVIVNSNTDTLTLESSFSRNYPVQAGDTIKLTGTPLKDARVFMFEPLSVKKAFADGKNFIITVNPLEGTFGFRGMAGHDTKGMSAANREYRLEVVVETPNISGEINNADDVKRVLFELPSLKEQVCVICHYFKLQEGSRVYGIGDIEYTYNLIQRPGAERESKACIIEFDINSI